MKRFTLLTTLMSLFVAASVFADDKIKHVDAAGAAKLVSEGKVTVVDVRTSDEFNEGHLKDAKNIDMMSKDFAAKLGELDKSKPVLVHCQAGGRSTRALPTLEKLGFTDIIHLDGGMNDWVKAGQPVVK
jgi:rhodanese-related sulfurtransferase